MITSNLQVEVTVIGDGENQDYVYNFTPNPNSPGPSSVLGSGNITVTVPINATGAAIIAPSNSPGTYKLKGVAADAGVSISPGGFIAFRFSAPGAITSFVLSTSVSNVMWTIYWL